jgi:predicted AlkP superfamily phosphohydrolase/phosphomutase
MSQEHSATSDGQAMTTKVLLVAFDGAERSLVDAWSQDGRLPALAELRDRGRWGVIQPEPGLGDDAVWGSFSTTVGPARHGRFYHRRLTPDGVDLVMHSRDEIAVAPFWDALVDAGKRVAIVDVPKSPLGHDGAFVVADWMTHGAEGPMRLSSVAATHPVAERLELGTDFDCNAVGPTVDDVAAFERELVRRTDHRTSILLELLENDEWDLFVAAFGATHCAGHRAWRDHDAAHPEHDVHRHAQVGDVVEHVYSATDRGLQALVEAAGDDALVIVFSLLGMGANHSGSHLVEDVMAGAADTGPSAVTRLLDRARHAVPPSLRRRAPKPVAGLGRSIRARNDRAKPYRVLPFDLPATALRISAADAQTDAEGVRHVPPAARRELVEVLGAIVDPDSGRPLVEDVVFTTDVYPGARTSIDAYILWDASAPIVGAQLDGGMSIRRRPPADRSGNHRAGGWFVAAGPGVVCSTDPLGCEIVDLGATVAAQLGVELTSTDGRVLPELAPDASIT